MIFIKHIHAISPGGILVIHRVGKTFTYVYLTKILFSCVGKGLPIEVIFYEKLFLEHESLCIYSDNAFIA